MPHHGDHPGIVAQLLGDLDGAHRPPLRGAASEAQARGGIEPLDGQLDAAHDTRVARAPRAGPDADENGVVAGAGIRALRAAAGGQEP